MLSGVRIIEIEGIGPGPFTGMLLADLGAEVIVAHRKGGAAIPGAPDRSLLDRGKRSIDIDLKDPADVEIVRRLIERADGLIEGFRPGVMERLGLGPDPCHRLNPALVYGRITGWGQDGVLSGAAGHDLNYIAMSGAAWYASNPGEAPFAPPTLLGDIGGGAMYLAVGMLAGLLRARASGEGTVVDAAIYDGSAHLMNLLMMMRQSGQLAMTRGESMLDGPHWSRCYATSDGGHMSVQCIEQKFYFMFLKKLGLSEDADFQRQFDRTLWPELTQRLAAIFRGRTLAEWAEVFLGSDACVAPVLSPEQALRSPINTERKTWREDGGVLQAAAAPRFAGAAPWVAPPIPARGEHREEILLDLAGAGPKGKALP
ncbi:CaiB/BaiF CoA transferase family protein [Paracoccus sp. (in: a-proteobacteria)]|uniref:CaiB/BaiF CoA transferase family protein n=1 Tax=Paracoccus sp. TaxID=267 RepID=UPI003A8AEEB9